MTHPATTAHYRNDDPNALPPGLQSSLDTHYLKNLPNLTTPNPRLLIVFSGGSAVGKSTLSKKIGQELHGLVLENDGIKEQLAALKPTASREQLNAWTWQYSMNLYGRLSEVTPNGLIVRDGVIDWYYDRILPVFEAQKYPVFIIGFDVSREKRVSLIHERGHKATITTERLVSLIEEQNVHIERFRSHHTPDLILTDANLFEHDQVIAHIRQQLQMLYPA